MLSVTFQPPSTVTPFNPHIANEESVARNLLAFILIQET